jgi:hypothetical protein
LVGTRTGGRASVEIMGAVGTRETEVNVDFQIEIVPADGTRAAIGGAETSVRRRFGQRFGQAVPAPSSVRGLSDVKHNRGRKINVQDLPRFRRKCGADARSVVHPRSFLLLS